MSKQLGNLYETQAKQYLQKQGLKILEQNAHAYRGEIDLVCLDHDTVVFVEVRYRNTTSFANSLESIGYLKQKKLIKAAEYYLLKKGWTEKKYCRFDVIAIDGCKPSKIHWIKDAFQA